jgi:hypothetical protein
MGAGDFDGDGLIDLAVHQEPGQLRVFVQDSSRDWQEGRFLPFATVPSRKGVARAYPADLDGDGRLDVLLAHQSMQRIYGFCQADPGVEVGLETFKDPIVLDPGGVPGGAVVEDWNGDGLPDIAASVHGASTLRVFYQRSAAGFDSFPSWPIALEKPLSGSGILAAGDVTGDSRPEILLLGPSGSDLGIVRAR